MLLTRRAFFGAMAGAGVAAGLHEATGGVAVDREPAGPLVDLHVHLFGVGDGGTGCFLSPRQRARWNYPFFLRLLRIEENGRMDQEFVERLVAQMRGSRLARAVLLAQDLRYDAAGRPDPERTEFHVPNDWVFTVCAQHPDLFLPCVSINPMRRDAQDELARCAARGARMLKIHPPVQAVDPGEGRFAPFYRRCAALGVVVAVHTGPEHAASIAGTQHCSPARLATALEAGCTVLAAHSGMGNFFDREDFLPDLLAMVRRYEKLYCDTAILGAIGRWRNIPALLRHEEIVARLVHASDWPFPANPLVH